MSKRFAAAVGISAATIAFVFACGPKRPPKNIEPPVTETSSDASDEDLVDAAPKSLFDRLGGKDAIGAVVDKFILNIQEDGVLKKSFAKLKGDKLAHFRSMLVDQVCEVTGGPCTYTGKDMKTAHKGMKISGAQFDAVVADLQAAMTEMKVADQEQGEVVQLLGTMREDIVTAKGKK